MQSVHRVGFRPLIVLLGASLLAAPSKAYLLLDTFSDKPSSLTDTTTTLSVATYNTGSAAYGGSRAHFLSQTSAPAAGGLSASVISGGFSGSNTTETSSIHGVYYGAVGISADMQSLFLTDRDYDFSGESGFRVFVTSASAGSTISVQLRDSGPSEPVRLATFSQTLASDITSPTVLTFLRSSPTSIDPDFHWERLDYIRLRVATPAGGAFSISRFETVPEPVSVAGLGLGLTVFMKRRRKASLRRGG